MAASRVSEAKSSATFGVTMVPSAFPCGLRVNRYVEANWHLFHSHRATQNGKRLAPCVEHNAAGGGDLYTGAVGERRDEKLDLAVVQRRRMKSNVSSPRSARPLTSASAAVSAPR